MRIHLHSLHSDFADTERLPASRYLGRRLDGAAPLAVFGCGCGRRPLVRMPRARWMRLLPLLRLYLCLSCGARVLRPRLRQRVPYGAMFVGARASAIEGL
jgi:hypothetical protein